MFNVFYIWLITTFFESQIREKQFWVISNFGGPLTENTCTTNNDKLINNMVSLSTAANIYKTNN